MFVLYIFPIVVSLGVNAFFTYENLFLNYVISFDEVLILIL